MKKKKHIESGWEREDGEDEYRKESKEVKSVGSSCSEHEIDCEEDWEEKIATVCEREKEEKEGSWKAGKGDGVIDIDG